VTRREAGTNELRQSSLDFLSRFQRILAGVELRRDASLLRSACRLYTRCVSRYCWPAVRSRSICLCSTGFAFCHLVGVFMVRCAALFVIFPMPIFRRRSEASACRPLTIQPGRAIARCGIECAMWCAIEEPEMKSEKLRFL